MKQAMCLFSSISVAWEIAIHFSPKNCQCSDDCWFFLYQLGILKITPVEKSSDNLKSVALTINLTVIFYYHAFHLRTLRIYPMQLSQSKLCVIPALLIYLFYVDNILIIYASVNIYWICPSENTTILNTRTTLVY